MPFFNHVCEFTTECPDRLKEIKNTTNNCKDNISVGLSVIKIRKSLFCQCCDFSEHKKTVTNEVKKKDNIAHSDTNGWILTCRLMPKNCQTWRLWYLYLDGICASMEVQCQCFKPRNSDKTEAPGPWGSFTWEDNEFDAIRICCGQMGWFVSGPGDYHNASWDVAEGSARVWTSISGHFQELEMPARDVILLLLYSKL